MKYSLSASKFFCHSNFFTNSIFKRPRIYSKRPIRSSKTNVFHRIPMRHQFMTNNRFLWWGITQLYSICISIVSKAKKFQIFAHWYFTARYCWFNLPWKKKVESIFSQSYLIELKKKPKSNRFTLPIPFLSCIPWIWFGVHLGIRYTRLRSTGLCYDTVLIIIYWRYVFWLIPVSPFI